MAEFRYLTIFCVHSNSTHTVPTIFFLKLSDPTPGFLHYTNTLFQNRGYRRRDPYLVVMHVVSECVCHAVDSVYR